MDKHDIQFRTGQGNWRYCEITLDELFAATEKWKEQIYSIEKPWLVWNVSNDWSVIQQRLIKSIGWTPVVGWDPRIGPPTIEEGSISVNFNEDLNLPNMYPHFPLEFTFLFAKRLAFWHSDLLIREDKLQVLGNMFANLNDGEIACVKQTANPLKRLMHMVSSSKQRYWELVGCTTAAASKSQFEHGCGWWMSFAYHPNFKGNNKDSFYWDHGSGIYYWHKHHKGKVRLLSEKQYDEGHFTQIKNTTYQRVSPNNHLRNLSQDLTHNFELTDCARKLGLEKFL